MLQCTFTGRQSTVQLECNCQRFEPAAEGSETRRAMVASEAIAPCCSVGRACYSRLGNAAAVRQIAF